jgi:hypothetical protein
MHQPMTTTLCIDILTDSSRAIFKNVGHRCPMHILLFIRSNAEIPSSLFPSSPSHQYPPTPKPALHPNTPPPPPPARPSPSTSSNPPPEITPLTPPSTTPSLTPAPHAHASSTPITASLTTPQPQTPILKCPSPHHTAPARPPPLSPPQRLRVLGAGWHPPSPSNLHGP